MNDLEDTEKAKKNIDVTQARENYQKEQWLNGIDGEPSGLQLATEEILKLTLRNKAFEREIELRANLAVNELTD
jgi:hypothetical protein